MTTSMIRALLLAAIGLGTTGACKVDRPAGYDVLVADAPTIHVEAARRKLTDVAPTAWNLPDGRQARLDVQDVPRPDVGGTRRGEIAFDVWIEGDGDDLRLSCGTAQRGLQSLPTRFACWSTDATDGVTFTVGQGSPECTSSQYTMADLLRSAECWQSELQTPRGRYTVRYSTAERSKAVINQPVWYAAGDTPVQAASSLGWDLDLHRGAAPTEDHDALLLHALALQQWMIMAGGA